VATCSENVAVYIWDFDGDGSFDVSGEDKQIVSHTYHEAGTYFPTLQVVNSVGDSDTHSGVIIEVKSKTAPIEANFNIQADSFYEGCTIEFVNMSTGADAYVWDFGDGITSTETNPVHYYMNNGAYQAELKAYFQGNLLDSIEIQVSISAAHTFINQNNIEHCHAEQIVQLTNGDYFITGTQQFYPGTMPGNIKTSPIVLNVDNMGNLTDSLRLAYDSDQKVVSMVETNDGELLCLVRNFTNEVIVEPRALYLTKINLDGKKMETRLPDISSSAGHINIYNFNNRYYVIYEEGGTIYYYHITPDGTYGNIQAVGGTGGKYYNIDANTIIESINGGFVMACKTGAELDLIFFDQSGNPTSTISYSGFSPHFIIASGKDGYVIGGKADLSPTSAEYIIIKTDISGNQIWEKSVDLPWIKTHVATYSIDNNLVLLGQNTTALSIELVKFNLKDTASVLWKETYDFGMPFYLDKAILINEADCGYKIVGTRDVSNTDPFLPNNPILDISVDVTVIKTDGFGKVN